MSWLYSLGLVEAYSAEHCSDGALFAPLSTSHTPRAYLSPDKMTDFSRLSRFGMTFAPLTADLGEDVLTWFLAGFPARTSVQPEKVQESPGNGQDSGWKWRESSTKYDHDSRLWKTRQFSLLEDSEWFSETWPQWGLMRDGECWELPISAHPIFAKESGLWPTPVKTDGFAVGWCKTSIERKERGECRPSGARIGTGLRYFRKTEKYLSNGYPNPALTEWLMGWPRKWTDLKPLETAKSPSVPLRPGGS